MNKLQLYWALIFIVFSISSCSKFDSSQGNEDSIRDIKYHKDMIEVFASGKTLTWNDVSSDSIYKTTFNYDYRILDHEVTNKEYSEVMAFNPPSEVLGDDYPVTNLSYYDAILYCNALSKQKGLDTVYQYLALDTLKKASDQNNFTKVSVYNIQVLEIDYTKNGYRLPTEAEWLFAVKKEKNIKYPWGNDVHLANDYACYNNGIYGGVIQKVKSLEPTSDLYDMSGNVMEWVNDWYGKIPNESFNYVGPAYADVNGSKVVKGGSFSHSEYYLDLSVRKDVYGNKPSTKNSYIGFRIVRGIIENCDISDINGQYIDNINIATRNQDVLDFANTGAIKLVFVNNYSKNLMYIDYKQGSVIYEIDDGVEVNHPVISPDGEKVAFSTASEGQILPSKIYVRSLNKYVDDLVEIGDGAIPRWWVDSAFNDTFLVYVSSAMSNSDSLVWVKEKTIRKRFNEANNTIAKTLVSTGSFNGGISKDGRYLATGSTQLRVYSEDNGVENLFQSPENGKSSSANTQVCNVSMSGEENPRLSFIDFGYSGESSIVGSSYDIHEYLFISDIEGNIEQSIKAPDNLRWKHPEWAYGGNIIVSNVEDKEGNNQSIYLQSVDTISERIKIIDGDGIKHPYLWMDTTILEYSGIYNLDSIGQYALPDLNSKKEKLDNTLRLFWDKYQGLKIAILGHSRAERVFPIYFSEKALNLAVGSSGIYPSVRILNDYLLNHCDSLEVVIMSLGIDLWDVYDNPWNQELKNSVGYNYDKGNDFWINNITPEFLSIMGAIPKSDVYKVHEKNDGAYAWYSIGFGWEKEVILDFNTDKEFVYEEYLGFFKVLIDEMIKPLNERGIKLIGVQFPQSPAYATSDYYGRYGPKNEIAQKLIDSLENLANEYSNFYFMDEYNFGNHDYIDDKYSDEIDHLNLIGAEEISKKLAEFVSTLP